MNDPAQSETKSDSSDSVEQPEKGGEEVPYSGSGGAEAVLQGDFRVQIYEPLSRYDKGPVKAYRVVSGSKHSANLFAMICDKGMTPRFLSKSKYSNIGNPNLCALVQAGKTFWPPENQERYCFIYEDTMGNPFVRREDKSHALGWKPETVLANIIGPMITILKDFRNKEFFHGEIWPGNMFDGGAKPGQKINLGECLSSPASSQLPSLYEPIERALAAPMGRGLGDIADDLYSFGASLAVMLRSEDPMAGVSDEKVIEYKIEKGSYATLLGQERLSGGILELLRGLLYDDPDQRWTLDDLEAWLDGRRLSPKQAPKRVKSTRPIIYRDTKYIRPELLAKDLYLDPDEAAKLVENNEMEQWIDRAIEDKTVKVRLEQAQQYMASYERGGSYNNRVSVAIAHALYPDGCVRYKNINFTPQGFGKYFTQAYVEGMDLEPFIEVIKYNFINPIIRESRSLERSLVLSNFDVARSFLKQKGMNAGLERCIYTMDSEAPCLSPILDKYYVLTLRDMMAAFESICEKSSKATILFDRHVIAFLSSKGRQNIDPYLVEISSSDPRERILGQLKVLATIQKRLGLGAYPAIARWAFDSFDPVLSHFHDRKSRDALKKKAQKLVRNGDLKGIASIFDNPKLYENDLGSFYQAMEHYQLLVEEQKLITRELGKGNRYGQNTGRQIASVISMIISFLIIILAAYQAFLGGWNG